MSGEWWLPNRPQQLLARREGDCDDKAMLLITLLRSVGIEAQEVMVQTRMTGQPSLLLSKNAAAPYPDTEEGGDELAFRALAHLTTRDVAAVLERTRDRMTKYLRRRCLLDEGDDATEEGDASELAGLTRLAASAVSGQTPPAGPEWRRGGLPVTHRAMVFERPLCAPLDGFTLHAATRAGGLDLQGREALLKYILRPAVAPSRRRAGARHARP